MDVLRPFYSQKISPRLNVDAGLRYVNQKADLDEFGGEGGDDPNYTSDTRLLTGHVRGRVLVSESYRQTLTLSLAQTKRETANPEDASHVGQIESYDYTGRSQSVDWLHEIALSDLLTLKSGVGGARDSMIADEKSTFYGDASLDKKRTPIWLYAELEHGYQNGPTGRVGARIESTNNELVKSVSMFESVPSNENISLEMSVGYNERMPTMYQLYSQKYGNENLQTEHAVAGVLGIVSQLRDASIGLQGFVTEFRNLVDFDQGRFVNVGRAETYGANVEVKTKSSFSTTTVQYGYLKARDLVAHRALSLRPAHRVNVSLASDESMTLGSYIKLRYTSQQTDFGGQKTLPSKFLWELGAHYWFTENFNLYARLENLTNVRYETTYGYAGEPRIFYLGATAKL